MMQESETDGVSIRILPPKGTSFRICDLCGNPFVYCGDLENCLWCEIHKEEHEEVI